MSKEQFDTVVIGNVGIDTNVYFYGNDIDFNVEANFTENIDCLGQAGGYASRGYAKLGMRTSFIGYVGDDFSGDFIRQSFARDGIDMTGMLVDPWGTSRSVNFMYPDGRRKNFYDGKAHMKLHPDMDVCRTVLAGAKLAHFNIPNWARYLLPEAQALGVTVACDLQDVVTVHDDYRRDFIQYADIAFFSSVNYDDPSPLMHAFWEMKPDLLLVAGLGVRGCAVGHQRHIQFFPPVALDAPVIDTNGAGDSLAVGFLTAYVLRGLPIDQAVMWGQVAARHTCAQKATSANFITREALVRQVDRLLER